MIFDVFVQTPVYKVCVPPGCRSRQDLSKKSINNLGYILDFAPK
ncbi:hypothetical protein EJK48_0833 [Moraxella catarrhalis]|uniref:Uncharacterized protein n=1 Tax=Moraxella catarrhalis TaxID=480 RepID=A0A3Q9GDF3_MORCA|nr:hypothetical protein EJK53_0832 [Moraxella catarrhalis]AZQ94445.1 hypothetical protein EJK48_0833 [Moraxella catarrhalis]EGE13239.1 hypothetical protein E9O_09624 [Moraxella catarrhalis 12P80B1]RUO14886.1 hypothetical protein EJK49_2037 [Moraxella catarrhalis]